jgi:hypothetical protein
MRSKWLVVGAILIGLSGCKTAEQALLEKGVMPMHEAQMRKELVGNTLYAESLSGNKWVEYLDKNGTARLRWANNGVIRRGTWTMKEFHSCFSYEADNAGIPVCFKKYKDEDEILSFRDKGGTTTLSGKIYRIEPGNVEGL